MTKEEYKAAMARIDEILDIERTPEQEAEMDALFDAVHSYEDRHFPFGPMRILEKEE